jgi:YD repeat-containing protein
VITAPRQQPRYLPSFDGVFTTVNDQAGKTRRQKVDALGRVIRLDEPTTSGLGSTSSPNQATAYEYDLLDNLVHIQQSSQDRYFKYDSLSRLIRERQVEQETNSSYNLSDAWNSSGAWTRKIEYNSSGLVTEADDARGVRTQFSYDDLNRVTQIQYENWDNSAQGTPTAHYYYDGSLPSGAPSYTATNTTGRLTAMTYGSGTPITGNYFAYDVMGRVITQKQEKELRGQGYTGG